MSQIGAFNSLYLRLFLLFGFRHGECRAGDAAV